MNDGYHRRGLIGPLLLIGIGVLFLMNNLGTLNWSVWELIFRLWPVFLIAAGLDLVIGRGSVWGAILAVILVVAVVAFGVWSIRSPGAGTARARQSLSFPIQGAKRAEVNLSPAVGIIRMTGTASGDDLLSGSTWTGGGVQVVKDYRAQGEVAVLNIRAEGAGVIFPTLGPPGQPTWDLMLTSAIPVDLSGDLGVGQSVIDLRGTQVYSLRVNQAIGQTVVYLPRNGVMKANLSMAIGETVVVIPPSVSARIHTSTGIAARSIPSAFVQDGDTYTSPDYAEASDKVDLELEVAIGNVSVRVGTQ
jgi:hypothetical protein